MKRAEEQYFGDLCLELGLAVKLHCEYGMLDKDENGYMEWSNVFEHCLLEAARAREYGAMLQLPEAVREDLELAAALHDFYKKREKEIVIAAGLSWESFEVANHEATAILAADPDISTEASWLTGAVGHTSLESVDKLLKYAAADLTDYQVAYLVMHYIDDYTSGSDWVRPGLALEKRILKNASNPRYQTLDAAGAARFAGVRTFQKQFEIARAVERRLSELMRLRGKAITIEPSHLPQIVDAKIHERILDYAIQN